MFRLVFMKGKSTIAEPEKMLCIYFPSLDKWYLDLPTNVGYSSQDLSNGFDGMSIRRLVFIFMGLGFSYTKKWNFDGRQ